MFEQVKVFWDTNVHCDNAVEARRSDIIVIDKKEQKKITINIVVPADVSVGEQERDKVEMYQDLKRERERERERDQKIVETQNIVSRACSDRSPWKCH